MNEDNRRGAATIGLSIERRRNRALLAELLEGDDLVDLGEAVPDDVDLCVVDEVGVRTLADGLTAWKRDQRPVFAPVILLAESGNPWADHADALGETLDAILDVPVPPAAVRARIDALLETRRYARELADERELVDRIFETSPVAETVLDTEGIIRRANTRAESVLGLDASEIEGRAYDAPEWQLTGFDGDPIPPGELPFDRVIATGEAVYGEELVVERPDGERAWLSVNMSPVRDGTGDIEYLVTAMDDVTEERRLERELRASEELHRTTLENITDTVVLSDDAGRFTYVCPNTAHIFGHSTAEVEALGHIEVLLGTDPAPADLDEIGLVENRELTITDTDGREHVVLVTVKAVSIQEGSRLYSVRDVTARAATEQALQETVESRSLALEAADAGVWQWDVEADELELDASFERLTGLDADDVAGIEDVIDALVQPEDRDGLGAAIEGILADAEPFTREARVVDGEGRTRWLESRGRVVTDRSGQPVRLLGVAIDVTERRERELALERFERIVETAPDPIYALDVAGDITLANDAFADLLDVDVGSLVGSNITDHLSPENVEASLEHIVALAEGDADPGALELTIETADEPREFEVNVALLGGDDETGVPGTVGVAHDVTERRKREQLLRRAQRAIEASGHAVYITDPDGTITFANPAFETVTGYTPEEAIGRDPSILNGDEHPPGYFEELWASLSAGETWEEEIVNRRKSGERYHAAQTIAPILDESGEIDGFVAIQTDITDHKDRLQQLRVMDRVLRHNLHNVLNVVMGRAALIVESESGGVVDEAAIILEQSRDLLDLTDKQRRITKVLSSEPSPERVDVVELVERHVPEVSQAHPEATIEVDVPVGATAWAADEVDVAVRELLENAVGHHDRDRPRAWVTVRTDAEAVEIRVADDGPGIPETERRLLTGEQDIEPLYHGSGLGLRLVWWTVSRSDGTVTFEENDPRGTVVTVRLPRADPAATAEG